jgi:hypothetical protein
MEVKKSKKNTDLAALLGGDAGGIEEKVTGTAPKKQMEAVERVTAETEVVEAKHELEEELGLPKAFARAFKRNAGYDKTPRTTTIVYTSILKQYKRLAEKMEVDTVVLLNNVLAEWHNKHLDSIDKVINRKSDVRAL